MINHAFPIANQLVVQYLEYYQSPLQTSSYTDATSQFITRLSLQVISV